MTAVLVAGSACGSINRVLWLHRTDRWYFGDFLRHAAWLQWLRDAFPGAVIDLASHPAYLPLYEDERFSNLLDATDLDARSIRSYDLVLEPAAYEPSSFDDDLPLLLTTWDTGWALRINGRPRFRGKKRELNYFRAAHPSAIIGPRKTWPSHIELRRSEIETVAEALSSAFPEPGPVIVYNPTASNPFTRGTDLPKEIDNVLSAHEHARVLRRLTVALPDHGFIVGSSLKPGDTVNARTVQTVAGLSRSSRVVSIDDLALPNATTIRGFAALLGSDRVCSVTGAGTGTNTHLASLLGTYSFSIERGADAQMAANWSRSRDFQMGSFRWRNPSISTGIHTLDWSHKTDDALTAAADAFVCHHALAHRHTHETLFVHPEAVASLATHFERSWASDPVSALQSAEALVECMTPAAQAHYDQFDDEAAYLKLKFSVRNTGLRALAEAFVSRGERRTTAIQLFEDSNLHKLLIRLATRVEPDLTAAS